MKGMQWFSRKYFSVISRLLDNSRDNSRFRENYSRKLSFIRVYSRLLGNSRDNSRFRENVSR